MKSRVSAAWLLVVGIMWLLIAVWVMVVMSGISTPGVSVWLLLIMYYAGPIALIIGSSLVITGRYSRMGVLLAFLACGCLTWMMTSDLWRGTPENEGIAPVHYDWFSAVLAVIVVTSDAAFIVMWRTLHHSPNR